MTTTPQNSRASRLDGARKVAIVTGGSRGIGLSIARELVDAGASVAITGRDRAHLESAKKELAGGDGSRDQRVLVVPSNAADPADAARVVAETVARFGGLDVLVNNAGVGVFANVADMSDEQWQQVLGTNLSGVFYSCRAAIPALRSRGGGWIINISSLAGANAFAGGAAYCASKSALNAFSESLMQEVRHDNIRVSYVMPGSVATGFGGRGAAGAEDWKLAPEDVAEVVIDLLAHPARSLPSRVEIRPSKPPKK